MKYLFSIFTILMFIGCKSDVPIVSNFYKDGVIVEYNTSKDLNFFDNEPHSLDITIYQLSSKDVFTQMCNSLNSQTILLQGKNFDTSMKSVNKKVIFPNEKVSIKLDKFKDTRYLGVIAGFYPVPKCKVIPFQVQDKYFNSLKFWQHKEVIKTIKAEILFSKDDIEIKVKND